MLRKLVIRQKGLSATKAILSASEEIGIGFAAGVISRAISTPLSLITVRLQAEKQIGDGDEDASVSSVVGQIYEYNGLRGFWKGIRRRLSALYAACVPANKSVQASRQPPCCV